MGVRFPPGAQRSNNYFKFMKKIISILPLMSLLVSGVAFAQEPVVVCHSTGSEKNPVVEITVDSHGMNGHGHHGDSCGDGGGGEV